MPVSNEEIAEEIRRYCQLNPSARDSVEGIAWWVAFQLIEETRGQLQLVIDNLVAQGELSRFEIADGSVLFACRSCAPRLGLAACDHLGGP
jgi:hypothetical protein